MAEITRAPVARVVVDLSKRLYQVSDALQLRVKDLDFGQRAIFVREGKGGKERVVTAGLADSRQVPRICGQSGLDQLFAVGSRSIRAPGTRYCASMRSRTKSVGHLGGFDRRSAA